MKMYAVAILSWIVRGLTLLLIMVATASYAAPDVTTKHGLSLDGTPTVVLISNTNHSNVVHHIQAAVLASDKLRANIISIDLDEKNKLTIPDNLRTNDNVVYVSVGPKAFAATINAHPNAPILATVIYKYQFKDVLANVRPTQNHAYIPNATAIFLDQPFRRQLYLIHCLLPEEYHQGKVGAIFGDHSIAFQAAFKKISRETELQAQSMHVGAYENPVNVLSVLFKQTNVLMTVPDEAVYNSHTARTILLAASKRNKPIIGYSRALVDIGALAAVYSTSEQIARQTTSLITEILANGSNNAPILPRYPKFFNIATNSSVAQSLNLTIPDGWHIKFALEQMEAERKVYKKCYQQLTQ